MSKLNNKLILLIVFLGLILDRATKFWAQQNLANYTQNSRLFFFEIKNTDLIVVLLFFILFLIYLLSRALKSKNYLLILGLSLIIGGGMSNLVDRILLGFVIDWIDILPFSSFNIADLMIGGGIILALVSELKTT